MSLGDESIPIIGPRIQTLGQYERTRKVTVAMVDRMIREQNILLANALEERFALFKQEIEAMLPKPFDPSVQPTDPDDEVPLTLYREGVTEGDG